MIQFGNTVLTYDNYGNRLTKGNTLTWTRGRLLSQYGGVSFQYDGEGFRRTKVNGTDTVTYYYQDGKLLSEKHSDTSKNLYFIHHGNEIVGFLTENVDLYYYQKDVLGNVIAIYNPEGEKVASYTYDAWGNCTIGTNVDGLADLNPIRYRGYYYDTETGLYYLQTRFYDPATGRFISPDTVEYLDPETIHGLNLYAYCNNNPVMGYDPTGHLDGGKLLIGTLAITAALLISVVTVGTAAPVLAGLAIGATVSFGFELSEQISNGELNIANLVQSTFSGAVSGAISALPLGGPGSAFLFGAAATTIGGWISGSVTDERTFIKAVFIGGIANLVGYGIADKIQKLQVDKLMKLSPKARSAELWNLKGVDPKSLLKESRYIFTGYNRENVANIVRETSFLLQNGIYSSVTSAFLSGWF